MSLPIALKPGVHYRLTKDIQNPDKDGRAKRDPAKQAVIPAGVEFMARGFAGEVNSLLFVDWPNYSKSPVRIGQYDRIERYSDLFKLIVENLEMLPTTPERYLRHIKEESYIGGSTILKKLMDKGLVSMDTIQGIVDEINAEENKVDN